MDDITSRSLVSVCWCSSAACKKCNYCTFANVVLLYCNYPLLITMH
jgi:hypothetical protein